jgi:hypothetical protein
MKKKKSTVTIPISVEALNQLSDESAIQLIRQITPEHLQTLCNANPKWVTRMSNTVKRMKRVIAQGKKYEKLLHGSVYEKESR